MRGRVTRSVLGVAVGLVLAAGLGGGAAPDATGPLGGRALHRSPGGAAERAVADLQARGRTAEAARLRRISGQPVATWLTGGAPRAQVERVTTAAAAAGEWPVLVAYDVPDRDCGSQSAGGAADDAAYLAWVREVAAGIGDRPAVVVLEPDAVALALGPCAGPDPGARFALLARAVDVLVANPGTRVYLDAGHAGWIGDLDLLAVALRAAGLDRAAGFSLNVSNFRTTAESVAYGRALSRRTGEARFVVDTSRNGSGPAPDGGGATSWCNPPGRTLGEAPTTRPGLDLVDALLWVKNPGESDGACRAGEPAAGEWFEDYALALTGSPRPTPSPPG